MRPADGDRARNTLYARSPASEGEVTEVQIIFRVYVPDEGTDLLGGVPLPEPALQTADGTTSTGEEACIALEAVTALPTDLPTLSVDQYRELVALGDPATHPAQDPPQWTRFFNARQALLSSFWAGTPQEAEIAGLDATEQGGYYAGTLILRQILAAPGFQEAIARVQAPGDEATTMGVYLPEMTYATATAFSVPGCD